MPANAATFTATLGTTSTTTPGAKGNAVANANVHATPEPLCKWLYRDGTVMHGRWVFIGEANNRILEDAVGVKPEVDLLIAASTIANPNAKGAGTGSVSGKRRAVVMLNSRVVRDQDTQATFSIIRRPTEALEVYWEWGTC